MYSHTGHRRRAKVTICFALIDCIRKSSSLLSYKMYIKSFMGIRIVTCTARRCYKYVFMLIFEDLTNSLTSYQATNPLYELPPMSFKNIISVRFKQNHFYNHFFIFGKSR